MHYSVQVIDSQGNAHHSDVLLGQELTIGSGENANISLPQEEKLLPIHILLAGREDTCWVSTSPNAPLWNEQGDKIDSGYQPWDAQFVLGTVQIKLHKTEFKQETKKVSNQKAKQDDKGGESNQTSSPIFIMFLLIALAYFGIPLVLATPSSGAKLGVHKAPPLMNAIIECKSKSPALRAVEARQEAMYKEERAVFDKLEAITAVQLYAESSACHQAAGQTELYKEVLDQKDHLLTSLKEEYQLLQIRLTHALDRKQFAQAQNHSFQLLQLLNHQSDTPYIQELRSLNLRLSKKIFEVKP